MINSFLLTFKTYCNACCLIYSALGSTEHFLTDYGDEANYKLPWELFTEESAVDALSSAQRCYRKLQNMLDVLASEPGGQSGSIAGVDPPSPLAGS